MTPSTNMGVYLHCYIPLFEQQHNKGKLAQIRNIAVAPDRCDTKQCKHPRCREAEKQNSNSNTARKPTTKRTAYQVLQAEYLSPDHGKQNFSRAAVPPGCVSSNQGLEGNFHYIKKGMLNNTTHAMHNSVNALFQQIRYHSQEQAKTRKFEYEIDFRKVAGPPHFKVGFLKLTQSIYTFQNIHLLH